MTLVVFLARSPGRIIYASGRPVATPIDGQPLYQKKIHRSYAQNVVHVGQGPRPAYGSAAERLVWRPTQTITNKSWRQRVQSSRGAHKVTAVPRDPGSLCLLHLRCGTCMRLLRLPGHSFRPRAITPYPPPPHRMSDKRRMNGPLAHQRTLCSICPPLYP